MKITVAIKTEEHIFKVVQIANIKEIEYENVDGFTFEYCEGNETGTGKAEQCIVIWMNDSEGRATFPVSKIAYIKTDK